MHSLAGTTCIYQCVASPAHLSYLSSQASPMHSQGPPPLRHAGLHARRPRPPRQPDGQAIPAAESGGAVGGVDGSQYAAGGGGEETGGAGEKGGWDVVMRGGWVGVRHSLPVSHPIQFTLLFKSTTRTPPHPIIPPPSIPGRRVRAPQGHFIRIGKGPAGRIPARIGRRRQRPATGGGVGRGGGAAASGEGRLRDGAGEAGGGQEGERG